MRKLILASICLAGLGSAADAAEVTFKGALIITAKTSACLLPYIEGNNALDIVWSYDTTASADKLGNFEIQDLMSQYVFTKVSLGELKGAVLELRRFSPNLQRTYPKFRPFGSARYSTTITITERQPTSVGVNTASMTLAGRINGFGGIPSCSVDFRAALAKF